MNTLQDQSRQGHDALTRFESWFVMWGNEMANPAEDSAYAEWLASGPKNVRGTIEQPNDRQRHIYVAPVQFPSKRLYFSLEGYMVGFRRRCVQSTNCLFDVPPQDFDPRLNAKAERVRIYVTPEVLHER